jgi:hypothetical protein
MFGVRIAASASILCSARSRRPHLAACTDHLAMSNAASLFPVGMVREHFDSQRKTLRTLALLRVVAVVSEGRRLSSPLGPPVALSFNPCAGFGDARH